VTVDTSRTWVHKAEEALRALRDVDAASIQVEGDEISEVHIVSRANRQPKQIVRDVTTVLMTRFNRRLDYRVVSVAFEKREPAAAPPAAVALVEPLPTAEPSARHAPEPEPEPETRRQRIRYGGVNLFVSGPRTQVQVELMWQGLPRLGTASGWSTRSGASRLVAEATLAAFQDLLIEEVAVSVQEVEVMRLGKRRAAVVSLSLLVDRQEKTLVGSCIVEQDVPQTVVLATLSALNRVVGMHQPKEPTEYVLRPTST
jgi:hypothetical protein